MGVLRAASILVVLAVVTAACGTDTEATTTIEVGASETTIAAATVPEETLPATTVDDTQGTTTTAGAVGMDASAAGKFIQLVESGDVEVEIVAPEGGVSGTLLDITLTNSTDDDLEFIIPCGVVMLPELAPDQRMITLSPIDVSLGADSELTVDPYVMCIDSGNAAPEAGAGYDVGELAGGALGDLAACVCDQGLLDDVDPVMGDLGLQMAVWAASDGELPNVEEGLAEVEGALGDVLGSEFEFDPEILAMLEGLDLEGVDLEAYGLEGFDLEAMMEQAESFLEGFDTGVQELLERCEIELVE